MDPRCYVKVKRAEAKTGYLRGVVFFDSRPYEKLAAIRGTAQGRHTDLKCVARWGQTVCPGISV
jgi:hypothetical protein